MATTGDLYVLNTQKWLNTTYGNDDRFNTITEDGKTGWPTIYALTRALQIELGITSTADSFGPSTQSGFKATYPNGVQQQVDGDETESNVYAIIQGALLCKGYSTGVGNPTLHFYNGTGNAIKKLKADAGCNDSTSTVTLNVMKALLSMDAFVSISYLGGNEKIRKLQQYLNRHYEEYIGLRACDGIYGRTTNAAIIYAIQAEEKLPLGTANGNFGPSTQKYCPTIPYDGKATNYNGAKYTDEQISKFVNLLEIALFCVGNGYEPDLEGTFDNDTITSLKTFQSKYGLSLGSVCTIRDWLSLLTSCGDTTRSAIACDCATLITEENVSVLVDNGYKYIGRYLSGTVASGASKALSTSELQILFKSGIRVFPIHQASANKIAYFTSANAINDANKAVEYAEKLHLQYGAIIYFAVDFDAMDYQVTDNIIPYFRTLYSTFMSKCGGKYRVGIYGTRNTCTRVCDAGYACSSFVSDMSTGFSGNLGFSIPENWAFDQFTTTTIKNNAGTQSIEIDKDGFSGQNKGISQEYSFSDKQIGYDTFNKDDRIMVNLSGKSVPVYSKKQIKLYGEPTVGDNYEVAGEQIGTIDHGEFYVRFGTDRSDAHYMHDNIHKVWFKSYDDIKSGYIREDNFKIEYNESSIKDHELFANVTYDGSNYHVKEIDPDNHISNEFTVNKSVPYFNGSTYQGMLPIGTRIRTYQNTYGASRPWNIFFDEIYDENTNTWKDFNMFVSCGIELGNYGKERALW